MGGARAWWLPAILLLVAIPASAPAALIRMESIEEMTSRSDLVLRGSVMGVETREAEGGARLFTIVTVRASKVFKGDEREAARVVLPGGRLGDLGQMVGGVPSFAPEEEVVLFLRRRPGPNSPRPADYSLVSLGLGAFRIQGDWATRRTETMEVFTEDAPRPTSLTSDERTVRLEELEARIQNALEALR